MHIDINIDDWPNYECLHLTYKGAEVETCMNVLDGDVCASTSLHGHDVPTPARTWGHQFVVSITGLPGTDVPVEDILVCFYFCPFIASILATTISQSWIPLLIIRNILCSWLQQFRLMLIVRLMCTSFCLSVPPDESSYLTVLIPKVRWIHFNVKLHFYSWINSWDSVQSLQ